MSRAATDLPREHFVSDYSVFCAGEDLAESAAD